MSHFSLKHKYEVNGVILIGYAKFRNHHKINFIFGTSGKTEFSAELKRVTRR